MMVRVPVRVLIAPDKFKGTFSAHEAAGAMADGVRAAAPGARVVTRPLADGGDGTAAVLVAALGGEWHATRAADALGRPVAARFALLAGGETAVVEVAEASGLARLDPTELDPLAASSAGTGELVAAAIEAGARRVLVACGGSASTDGGLGALGRFDPATAEIICLCDVADPFAGALRYAPQKGAGADDLEKLERRLERIRGALPHDPSRLPYTGAAGGLSGGLWAHGARLVPGARWILERVGFDRVVGDVDFVLTGEGRLDPTSARGKVVGEVARRSARARVRCAAIVGRDRLPAEAPLRRLLERVAEASTLDRVAQAAGEIALGAGEDTV